MTDPQKDEHIEELLSKLQGIFGKLSHTEEEETKHKPDITYPAPKEPEPVQTPAPAKPPEPLMFYTEPVLPVAPPAMPPILTPPTAPEAPPAPPPAVTGSTSFGTYESLVPPEDPEKMIVPTAVYFPPGREAEAKSLAMKLETITPRFTKVAFRMRVCVFLPYDPKSEWKDAIIQKSGEAKFRTVFVVMDRPLDDSRRKLIASDLEGMNIYFQEVTLMSIEKKAFYTDILLGLVFFFDSRKPAAPEEGAQGV